MGLIKGHWPTDTTRSKVDTIDVSVYSVGKVHWFSFVILLLLSEIVDVMYNQFDHL